MKKLKPSKSEKIKRALRKRGAFMFYAVAAITTGIITAPALDHNSGNSVIAEQPKIEVTRVQYQPDDIKLRDQSQIFSI
ncbi:hypothetical protein [Vibrio sp. SCSIO 43136]|uniref:hypothetical protein n=1 Tax=Vibrio sp. SCSIO 43136 TaxID=2819101 RepID=UPI002075FF39|nr:hypothetical protein [Vibrio sp. SCSIO 43136]USD63979.1 hypothetical protein J4N39_07525 [Vibrio sp. SCSIO 43136]